MGLVSFILFRRKALLKVTAYEMRMNLQYFNESFKIKRPELLRLFKKLAMKIRNKSSDRWH